MTQNGTSIPGPDNITRVELDNGIIVLVYENHAVQSVVTSGDVANGSIFEADSQVGLAAMTAGSLLRGTHTHDFEALSARMEDIGADLDFNARVHSTGFQGKALAEDLPTLIDILSDVLRQPTFPEPQVERLRGEILTWMQYSQQNTRYRAGRAFRETLYPTEHPYHHGVWGDGSTLPNLTVNDVRAFHQRHYGPKGMIIAIVGAVNADDAVDIVRERLGDWQNPDQPELPSLPAVQPLAEKRESTVTVKGKSQSDIVIGVTGPSRTAKDYMAATMANSILGVFGMMGRIGKVIREDLGLAYYAYSKVTGGHGPGAWNIIAGVDPENVQVTIEKALEEVTRITTTSVSEDDLRDNQSYFTGRLPLQLESNEGIASRLVSMESYGLGLDYLVNYADTVYGITRDDVLAAAQHYWSTQNYVVAVAGPDMS